MLPGTGCGADDTMVMKGRCALWEANPVRGEVCSLGTASLGLTLPALVLGRTLAPRASVFPSCWTPLCLPLILVLVLLYLHRVTESAEMEGTHRDH